MIGVVKMAIKINTGAIANSATRISRYNNNIKNSLSSVEQAVNSLNRSWDSGISDLAVNSFFHIKRTYADSRYIVIDDMRKFLVNIAGEGYENTESAVESVASAFK